MTNGFGAMPSYASRVEPDDRWRIVAYIRALQFSESAKITDVPSDQRSKMPEELPPTGMAATGAAPKPTPQSGARQ